MNQYHTELQFSGRVRKDVESAQSHQEAAEKTATDFHAVLTSQESGESEASYTVLIRELYDPHWKEYIVKVSGKKPFTVTTEERPTTRNPAYTKRKK